ncbi:DUF3304 domain-containing protein [Mangrovibacter sp. SLW1]
MNKKAVWLVVPLWLLAGCAGAGYGDYTAGDLRAKNHVAGQGINRFGVNGYSAPGLGGGYCCVLLPRKWIPGMEVLVEWEVDPDPYAILPPLGTDLFARPMPGMQHNTAATVPWCRYRNMGNSVVV